MKSNVPIKLLFIISVFAAECCVMITCVGKKNLTLPLSEALAKSVSNSSNSTTIVTETNGENENATLTNLSSIMKVFTIDNGAVKRTFYVVAALTGLVLVYIGVKAFRSSRKRKNVRRYGLLIDQEMEPLDGDDEDEDMTLFDAHKHKKANRK